MPGECAKIIKNGINITQQEKETISRLPKKKVVILGAGMAGLTAAKLLLDTNLFQVEILEAQSRKGGKVHTYRDFPDGMFVELGAMRIPSHHECVLELIKLFDLKVSPYIMSNPNGFVYINGKRWRKSQVERNPSLLGFPVKEDEMNKTSAQLWEESIMPLLIRLKNAKDLEKEWQKIGQEYDKYSIEDYLYAMNYSPGAIEFMAVMENQEGTAYTAFFEALRDFVAFNDTEFFKVSDGMDKLPEAFGVRVSNLENSINYGCSVVEMYWSNQSATITYEKLRGKYNITADYVINTLPFPILDHVYVKPLFSWGKQKAIRELHYDQSTKIYTMFRTKFWELNDGIIGGSSITTLPSRFIYYPTYSHLSNHSSGILLSSYTWGDDARKYDFMDDDEALSSNLKDIAAVHNLTEQEIFQQFESGIVWSWDRIPYAGGAFALYNPLQYLLLEVPGYINSKEGCIYFAGEHTSSKHAWIEGSLESAVAAVSGIVKAILQK